MRFNFLIVITCIFLQFACVSNKEKEKISDPTEEETSKSTSVPIIKDAGFKDGLRLLGTRADRLKEDEFIYPFGETEAQPIWKLAEWGSITELSPEDKLIEGDTVFYKNRTKEIGFLKLNEDVAISMELLGSKEYDSPRKNGENWPHILLEQEFKDFYFLTNLDSLEFNINAQLVHDINYMNDDEFDPTLHTAQMTFYLTIQNRNEQADEYGDYFWFGIPIYDFRHVDIDRYMAKDIGQTIATNKFIFSLSSKEMFNGSLHNQNLIKINSDLLPKIKEGFESAKRRGYLRESNWEDMTISSFNIGWEHPGTFNSKIILSQLSLNAVF